MTKNASPDELLTAVRRVAAGGAMSRPSSPRPGRARRRRRPDFDALSPRELEIMRLLAKGSSLGGNRRSHRGRYKTVANTASQIKSKLGVSRTADLVRLSIEAGVS